MILRKLGLPISQIQEVLDGVVPLQEALEHNIASLISQIDALNGALALSRQLHLENKETLDIDRCWELIQSQEAEGLKFQVIVDDYLNFTEVNYDWFLWPLPGESLRKPWKVAIYILIYSAIMAISRVSMGEAFLPAFVRLIFSLLRGLLLWTAVFIPIYLYSKRNKKAADLIMNILLILPPVLALLAIAVVMYLAFPK